MATKINIPLKRKEVLAMDRRALPKEERLVEKPSHGVNAPAFFGSDQVQAIAFRVSDYYAKGFNDKEILDIINQDYGFEWTIQKLRVLKDMLRKYWRSQTTDNMDDQINEEVNACNVQLRELWKAFEFSKRGVQRETTRFTHSSGESDELTFDQDETVTVKETTAGDTKIMAQIIEVSKEKRKLLGLYAPEKKSGAGGGGGNDIKIAIVGSNGEAAGNVLGALLNQAGKKQEQPVVEEAESEPVEEPEEERDLYSELMS